MQVPLPLPGFFEWVTLPPMTSDPGLVQPVAVTPEMSPNSTSIGDWKTFFEDPLSGAVFGLAISVSVVKSKGKQDNGTYLQMMWGAMQVLTTDLAGMSWKLTFWCTKGTACGVPPQPVVAFRASTLEATSLERADTTTTVPGRFHFGMPRR